MAIVDAQDTRTTLPPEDVAEYQSRVAKARELARSAGFDALVVCDGGPWGGFVRYFSGFVNYAPRMVTKLSALVIPSTSEVTLCVPPGFLGGIAAVARLRMGIPRVQSTYSEDPEWENKTNFGGGAVDLGADVAQALKSSGLASARIGIVGTWPGLEETKALVPNARFDPAVVVGPNGVKDSLLEPLTHGNSPWELARLEHAMVDADASIRVFMEQAQEGAVIADALADAHYRLERGGSEMVTMLMVGADPWFFAQDFKMLPRDTRFKKGDMVTAEWTGAFQGYHVQDIRTFVVGAKPSSAQMRVIEATKQARDEMVDRIEVGMTGDQLWNISLAAAKRAGLHPWLRVAHYMGFFFAKAFPTDEATSETSESRLLGLPGNRGTVREGDALTVQPGFIDKGTGILAYIGDTGIIENGRFRLLSKSPVGYGTSPAPGPQTQSRNRPRTS